MQSRWQLGPDDDDDATIVEGAPSPAVDDGLWSPQVPESGRRSRTRYIPPRQLEGPGPDGAGGDEGLSGEPYRTVGAVPLAVETDRAHRQRLVRSTLAVFLVAVMIVVAFLAGVWWAGRGDQAAAPMMGFVVTGTAAPVR